MIWVKEVWWLLWTVFLTHSRPPAAECFLSFSAQDPSSLSSLSLVHDSLGNYSSFIINFTPASLSQSSAFRLVHITLLQSSLLSHPPLAFSRRSWKVASDDRRRWTAWLESQDPATTHLELLKSLWVSQTLMMKHSCCCCSILWSLMMMMKSVLQEISSLHCCWCSLCSQLLAHHCIFTLRSKTEFTWWWLQPGVFSLQLCNLIYFTFSPHFTLPQSWWPRATLVQWYVGAEQVRSAPGEGSCVTDSVHQQTVHYCTPLYTMLQVCRPGLVRYEIICCQILATIHGENWANTCQGPA